MRTLLFSKIPLRILNFSTMELFLFTTEAGNVAIFFFASSYPEEKSSNISMGSNEWYIPLSLRTNLEGCLRAHVESLDLWSEFGGAGGDVRQVCGGSLRGAFPFKLRAEVLPHNLNHCFTVSGNLHMSYYVHLWKWGQCFCGNDELVAEQLQRHWFKKAVYLLLGAWSTTADCTLLLNLGTLKFFFGIFFEGLSNSGQHLFIGHHFKIGIRDEKMNKIWSLCSSSSQLRDVSRIKVRSIGGISLVSAQV